MHYELFKEERSDQGRVSAEQLPAGAAGATVIHVPGLDRLQESELEILRQLVQRYGVPEEHR